MNGFPSKETVERLRKTYPKGTRVELISMNDPYSKLKPGDKGTFYGGRYWHSVRPLGLRLRPRRRLWRRPYPQNLSGCTFYPQLIRAGDFPK